MGMQMSTNGMAQYIGSFRLSGAEASGYIKHSEVKTSERSPKWDIKNHR